MTTKPQTDTIDDLLSQAAACLEEKRYRKASKLCEKVLAKDPASAPAHMLIAGVLEGREDVKGAIESYRKAVECDPNHLPSWVNMGVCLKRAGNFNDAIDTFHSALKLDPDSLIIQYNLARSLFDSNRLLDAIGTFKSVLKQRPGWAEVHFSLGVAYRRFGLFEDALDSFRRAVDLKPDFPAALTELANGLQAQGSFDDARDRLQSALNSQPDYGRAHYLLSAMHPTGQVALDQKAALERYLETDQLSAHTRMSMHFAAARLYDQAEDYDRAFAHCGKGNGLFEREFGTSTRLASEKFANTRKVFSAAHFTGTADSRTSMTQPVFVAGLPRSGLTLVEQIISAHPQGAAGGELIGLLRCRRRQTVRR